MVRRPHPGDAAAFEGVADEYDATRPHYPSALVSCFPPLSGRNVVELGAGTGLATELLLGAGARVLATDIGPRMLARLRARFPGVPTLLARAEALPFATDSADLVCGAQMWHWVDQNLGIPEVRRVLRPGGALCLWWNEVDAADAAWFVAQEAALEAANPRYHRDYRRRDWEQPLRETGAFAEVRAHTVSWFREIGVHDYLDYLLSKSYVAGMPTGGPRERFLEGQRELMLAAFPSGVIVEPFQTRLSVCTMPS